MMNNTFGRERSDWLTMSSLALTCPDRHGSIDNNGGDDGNRTHDIYLAKVALCQLSYVPLREALRYRTDCVVRTTFSVVCENGTT